ncbi:MAG TPA: PIN domain-containing protein [Thermoanaerobaculia bacterium]|nr:PIN domain-containing protein [Thermoanaerobaculia bacterium]
MLDSRLVRVVVDTNVVFEGLTHLGSAAEVIDAWVARRFQPCISTALALEYQGVLERKLSPVRGESVLMALQALLVRCEYVPIYYSYRPSSPDPGDDLVVDCVLNSRAVLLTNNVKDFSGPSRTLGFRIFQPAEFMRYLNNPGQLELS